MKKYFSILCFLYLTCFSSAGHAANGPISASFDRDHIGSGQTVRLLVRRDGTSNGQIDIRPLQSDFDIVSNDTSSSVQINNGDITAQTQVVLVLAPKHDGRIQVPKLEWNGEHTEPLELTVGGKASVGQQTEPDSAQHVTLTTTVDQRQPYVQAAVVLTVRLSTDEPITQASLELAPNDAVLISQLGTDRQSSEIRNGHSYQVIERKYSLFPQRSGPISIAGPVLSAQVPDLSSTSNFGNDPFFASVLQNSGLSGMATAMRALQLRAKPIELDVLPRPTDQTGANWLPALSVKLTESWSADTSGVHAGEPLTRHLRLEAIGLTGAQLPDLSTLVVAPIGIKIYPDQAKIDDLPTAGMVTGSREQDIALIASQPGHYTMPPLRLSWWDTVNKVQREATLPAHEFNVLAALGGAAVSVAPQTTTLASPPANSTPAIPTQQLRVAGLPAWLWIALTCLAVGIVTLSVWWWLRVQKINGQQQQKNDEQPKVPHGSAASQFRQFRKACLSDRAQDARRHLLEWARLHWPVNPPIGLNALAQRLIDPDIVALLRELDRCCYTGSPWKGENLARSFTHEPGAEGAASSTKELLELYP